MKAKIPILSGVMLILLAGAFVCLQWYLDNRAPALEGPAELYVYPGSDVEDVVNQLSTQTTIVREPRLRRVFRKKQVDEFITPGHYMLSADKSAVFIARMLNNGWQSPVNLTLSGSLRLKTRIAGTISHQMLVDSVSVLNAMNDRDFLSAYGFTPETVFALFVPDTYEMYWTASLKEIFDVQKAAYDRLWNAGRLEKAAKAGLTPMQVSILASIVRGESNNRGELAKIAGVYLNRLKIGMRLQADPTVCYCFDYTLDRVLRKHLRFDSPYNTYIYAGLPPGPICVPPVEYIDAVLEPDFGGGNIFFCANSDFSGTHVFAKTLSEHNRNAVAFQRALTRRNAERRKQNKG